MLIVLETEGQSLAYTLAPPLTPNRAEPIYLASLSPNERAFKERHASPSLTVPPPLRLCSQPKRINVCIAQRNQENTPPRIHSVRSDVSGKETGVEAHLRGNEPGIVSAPFRLRAHQIAIVEILLARIDKHPRAYFCAPTGSGKSPILATVANEMLRRGRVIVIAPREEIVHQLAATLRMVTGQTVATLAAGKLTDASAPILVSTYQSFTSNRRQEWFARGPVSALLLDEAHHVAPGNSYATIIDAVTRAFPNAVVLGCTATPFRGVGRGRMQDVLPKCLVDRTIADLVALDVLTPLHPVSIKLKVDLRAIRAKRGDYDQTKLGAQMLAVVEQTVAKTKYHLAGKRSIVFGVNVKHARALWTSYENAGFPAFFVCGESSRAERARIIARWRITDGALLVNVGIASEGFDEPSIEAIVIAAPTQSAGLTIQRVGRGTRKHPGKVKCVVLDVTGSGPVDDRQATFESVFLPGLGAGNLGSAKASERRLFSSPRDDNRNRWQEVEPNKWILSIGERRFWYVTRNSIGSGLWTGRLMRERHAQVLESIIDEPLPELVSIIRRSIEAEGANPLVLASTSWRHEPSSEFQLRTLTRIDAQLATEAKKWTKGRACDVISLYNAKQTLSRHHRVAS